MNRIAFRNQPLATILITVLGTGLLFYTGTRTVRLVDLTLPTEDRMQGYIALFALDGGLLIWTLVFKHTPKQHEWQRGIALLMIVVSAVGVVAAMIADTWMQSSKNGVTGKVSEDLATGAIWIVTVVIALNVLAAIGMHLTHPEPDEVVTPEQIEQLKQQYRLLRAERRAQIQRTGQPTPYRADVTRVTPAELAAEDETEGALPAAGQTSESFFQQAQVQGMRLKEQSAGRKRGN